ncbi:hypothetical protein [Natronomonas sp. LN261]|uniref:hypothetical protein n=1 Tax=Natronomonas sp. LN261 TaxID=2750669 RepID=UPI0015EE6270|nr:hypothetical protein [Natronomonas sp. LN261]
MDREMLTEIATRYPWASWAVWDDEFPDGDCVEKRPERLVEFVHNQAEVLTPDIVLMGLNRSGDLPTPYANFHAPTRKHYDYRLKEFIQDSGLNRLQGAYMTDLVDEVDPDSQNVKVSDDDAAVLLKQLRLLGESEYHVVCFGNKPFDGLVDYFDTGVTSRPPDLKRVTVEIEGLTLFIYRVWFYGLYGANQDKVDVLKHQLQELNEQIA